MIIPKTTDRHRLLELLRRLKLQASQNKVAHYNATKVHSRWDYSLRIGSIILSVAVAGSLFSNLEERFGPDVKIGMALASFIAAALGFIQLFLRSGEKASNHKSAGSKYGSAERKIDICIASPPKSNENLLSAVEALNVELTTIAIEAPLVAVPSAESILSPTR